MLGQVAWVYSRSMEGTCPMTFWAKSEKKLMDLRRKKEVRSDWEGEQINTDSTQIKDISQSPGKIQQNHTQILCFPCWINNVITAMAKEPNTELSTHSAWHWHPFTNEETTLQAENWGVGRVPGRDIDIGYPDSIKSQQPKVWFCQSSPRNQ